VNQKQLFLDLEALSEEQIEVGLQAGVWGCPGGAARRGERFRDGRSTVREAAEGRCRR
jgi:hypothetical protein